jgi:pyridoxamine 5'-phosphate oxidase family protein
VSPFTQKEIEYLRGQPLGRLATVGPDGSPHIVPVGFRLDPEAETIQIGGHGLSSSKKWRDLHTNPQTAIAVDDLASVDPLFGPGWDSAWFSIAPRRIISWGIEGHAFSSAGRRSARTVTEP